MNQDDVGSLAEEAAKLIDAIASSNGRAHSTTGSDCAPGSTSSATSSATSGEHPPRDDWDYPDAKVHPDDRSEACQCACRHSRTESGEWVDAGQQPQSSAGSHRCPHSWCPVCQLTEYVQHNPELVTALTESATVFFASVRQVMDQMSGKEHR